MATIYDKNKNICGIIVKGNENWRVETSDSAISGKYSNFINLNILKQEEPFSYYLPLSFNTNYYNSNEPNQYFNYSINSYTFSNVANNSNLLNNERCWFNNEAYHKWMNANGGWSSMFDPVLLDRGFDTLKSQHGVVSNDGTYICYADKNQPYFIKPQLKHNESSYDIKYNYFNIAYKTNTNAKDMYITTQANNTSSTDITFNSTNYSVQFKLGYNGIISGDKLTDYIESVDTTNSTGRPLWQRMFFVAIKGGYNANNSYDHSVTKTNIKLCTFDQNTGLENESDPYLNSIPIKYKKLHKDVYLIQDNNFKTFQTYPTTGKYVIKKTTQTGDEYYYCGVPLFNYMEDDNYWTTNLSEATQLTEIPGWYTDNVVTLYEQNHHCSLIYTGYGNEYSVKISLPVIMNSTTATLSINQIYYITGSNGYAYTGTNDISQYETGKWSNRTCYFYSANNPFTAYANPNTIKYWNGSDFVTKFSPSYMMSEDEISYLVSDSSKYKWVLYWNGDGYWVSGYDSTATYSQNLTNNVQVFNSKSDAEAEQNNFNNNIPDVCLIPATKENEVFYNYDWQQKLMATMFTSYNAASNMVGKLYENQDYPPGGNSMNVYSNGNVGYVTKLLYNPCTTANSNYVEIPTIRWLSLNYFITTM